MALMPDAKSMAAVILVALGVLWADFQAHADEPLIICDRDKNGTIGLDELIYVSDLKLNRILEAHKVWTGPLSENGTRADLSCHVLKDKDLAGADLRKAIMAGAFFNNTDLSGAELSGADMADAYLGGANLSGATLSGADLTGAYLLDTDLTGANLRSANLTGASLTGADLNNAVIASATLTDSLWEPISAPNGAYITDLKGVDTLTYGGGSAGLVLLRDTMRSLGYRDLERQATFALERTRTLQLLGTWIWSSPTGNVFEATSSRLEKAEGWFRFVFLELPVGYGLWPGRAIQMLISLIPAMAIVYWLAITMSGRSPSRNGSIYRIAPEGRLTIATDGEPILLNEAKSERLDVGPGTAVIYAFYFSLLSAFHFGWRDLNVGNWLTKIQPTEYGLRASGWVRTVSGVQSLFSLYLLAMWALFYFGRPLQ